MALLAFAREGVGVPRKRADAFARAVLELSQASRLALAVLDGGLFAGARLVELAALVAEAVAGADGAEGASS